MTFVHSWMNVEIPRDLNPVDIPRDLDTVDVLCDLDLTMRAGAVATEKAASQQTQRQGTCGSCGELCFSSTTSVFRCRNG